MHKRDYTYLALVRFLDFYLGRFDRDFKEIIVGGIRDHFSSAFLLFIYALTGRMETH
jgi:hypothetical protein